MASNPRAFSLRGLLMVVLGFAIGLAVARTSDHFRTRITPSEAYAFDLPEYLIEPPDVITVVAKDSQGVTTLEGEFLVGPDGTVKLGPNQTPFLAGLSLKQARQAVAATLGDGFQVDLDVFQQNSKVFYLISDVDGTDQVHRIPITGNDHVLDALAHCPNADLSQQNIWISRPSIQPATPAVIPVNWNAITREADPEQNYQLLPGDRLFVSSHPVP